VKIRCIQMLVIIFIVSLNSSVSFSGETVDKDKVLHFDQSQAPLKELSFKHKHELKPVANDFRIVEISYLSNDLGERWAIATFENKSAGQRFLKNKSVVATFADGVQTNSFNLNETLKGNERLSKAVFFGVYPFPIVSVQIE